MCDRIVCDRIVCDRIERGVLKLKVGVYIGRGDSYKNASRMEVSVFAYLMGV